MSTKRTLELTHEQIEMIQQALGIAEREYVDIMNTIVAKTISVRGNNETETLRRQALFYHETACNFADLNTSIGGGELDV